MGRIVHGRGYKETRVQLGQLTHIVADVVNKLKAIAEGGKPPRLILNKHCPECEFRRHCRAIAVDRDDLSLLGGMTPKAILKQNARGIFTVTQYSHTFRPRRASKQVKVARKHDWALQALAIREEKVYVVQKPELPPARTILHLDVEGLPDQDFYYLIGMLSASGHQDPRYISLWADQREDEARIWHAFLNTVGELGICNIFHYGSYESRFLRRMTRSFKLAPRGFFVVCVGQESER